VIPNFVDTDLVRPMSRMTGYRRELGIGAEPVVMYAGNVGFSQSLDLMIVAARQLPDVTFVINGGGSARLALQAAAGDLPNLVFGHYQPPERLSEVLATGDIHVVPLRRGLARVSVPSKTYSILAAGRPVLASIDCDTEVPRVIREAGAGTVVDPDDPVQFVAALRSMLSNPVELNTQGASGRRWVEKWVSPAAVAASYEELFGELGSRRLARLRSR
jgi:colanic acid biosynthesis glycosyl transferase WcaI